MSTEKAQINITVNADGSKAIVAFNKLNIAVNKLTVSLFKINQATQFFSNITAGFKSLTETVIQGARQLDIENVFKIQAQKIGQTTDEMLAKIRKATAGTMTDLQAMTLTNQALVSNMNFDDLVTTLEYLRKYAKATDKDFKQLSNTIITGLVRGSTQLLDDAGIVIDQTTVLKAKQEELGRTLTEQEKKFYIVAEAIKQMKEKTKELGSEEETAADRIERLNTRLENMQNAITRWQFRLVGGLELVPVGLKMIWKGIEIAAVGLWLKLEEWVRKLFRFIDKTYMKVFINIRDKLMGLWRALSGNKSTKAMADMIYPIIEAFDRAATNAFDKSLGLVFDNKRMKAAKNFINDAQKDLDNLVKKSEGIQKIYFGSNKSPNYNQNNQGRKQVGAGSQGGSEYIGISDEDFDKAYMEGLAALERFGDDRKLEGLVKAKKRVDELKKSLSELSPMAKMQADLIHGAFQNMGFVLAETLSKFAQTGKFSFKELIGGLIKELQIYAAQKTAMLLMEAAYQGIMSIIDTPRAAEHAAKASVALKGAGIMGTFVLGSGLSAMAHSGLDYIPEDGTWLLQKGERVIDSKTNRDLKEYLKNGGKSAVVNMTVNINGGDEQSVLKALPRLKQVIVDVVSGDIAKNGQIRKTILTYI